MWKLWISRFFNFFCMWIIYRAPLIEKTLFALLNCICSFVKGQLIIFILVCLWVSVSLIFLLLCQYLTVLITVYSKSLLPPSYKLESDFVDIHKMTSCDIEWDCVETVHQVGRSWRLYWVFISWSWSNLHLFISFIRF